MVNDQACNESGPRRLILSGSPFAGGKTENLAQHVAAQLQGQCGEEGLPGKRKGWPSTGQPGKGVREGRPYEGVSRSNEAEAECAQVELVYISRLSIKGCLGCNKCANPTGTALYQCIIKDDMQDLAFKLLRCDALTVVTPIFFSGVPSQLKAIYDRLQPFFWRRPATGEKRPFDLVILGEGGDPYGYNALISESCSALAMAG